MPVYNNGIDWADAANTFATISGALEAKKRRKDEEARNAQLDPLTAALTQAQIGETRARTSASGYNPDTGAPTTSAVQYEQIPPGASPDKIFQIATRNLAKAATAKDQQGIKDWGSLAQTSSLGYERVTQGDFTHGPRSDQARATTAEIRAKTKNISGQFEHDIEMLKARGANAAQVAGIRAAYHRAGGGSSSTSAAEQRAMLAAMNAAEREQVDVKNSELMREYYRQQGLHDADSSNPAPDQPQLQTPPIVIMGPSGQPITVNVPSQQQGPAKTAPAAPQQSQQPQQGGGNPFGGLIQGIQHLLHLGGGQQDKFTAGQVYTDAKGRHAKYLGNGQWQPVP